MLGPGRVADSLTAIDESLGYEYEGKVKFVHAAKPAVPRVKLQHAHSHHRGSAEHRTILIKRDGSKYSKR